MLYPNKDDFLTPNYGEFSFMNNIECDGVRYKWFPYSNLDNEKICDEDSLMECPYEYDDLDEIRELNFLQIDGFAIKKDGKSVLTDFAVFTDIAKVYTFDVIEVNADGYWVSCEWTMPERGITTLIEGRYFVYGKKPDMERFNKLRFHDGKNFRFYDDECDEPIVEEEE